jgi:predicted SprT family Zn-dependent metalloprotease
MFKIRYRLIKTMAFIPRLALIRNTMILFFCIPVCLSAQQPAFSPTPQDSLKLAALLAGYEQQYKSDIHALPPLYKKDMEEVYKLRWDYIREKFNENEVYTDTAAQNYMNRLVAEIRKGNPDLPPGFTCYFSRTPVPNAEYIGEGIILFNMGLFTRLNNEGQVVYILCHEISHYLLLHSEQRMQQYVATLNSKETQEALRNIKKSEYQKGQQFENLSKGLTFDSRRHSRDHESQADSMAVELMRHTIYNVSNAMSALAVLDTIDNESLSMATYLPDVFNSPDFPFKKRWISYDQGLLGGHAVLKKEAMADSLKTHPDCQKRIILLAALTKSWSQPGARNFSVDSIQFLSLQNRFRYETIEYSYQTKNYTRSLFLTLELLSTRSDDPWLITEVGIVLNGMYNAQKRHMLSKVVDLPAPYFPANYNLILQFIQNLYLDEMISVNYYFLKKHSQQMDVYKPYHITFETCQQLFRN